MYYLEHDTGLDCSAQSCHSSTNSWDMCKESRACTSDDEKDDAEDEWELPLREETENFSTGHTDERWWLEWYDNRRGSQPTGSQPTEAARNSGPDQMEPYEANGGNDELSGNKGKATMPSALGEKDEAWKGGYKCISWLDYTWFQEFTRAHD